MRPTLTPAQRLWNRIDQTADGCWTWPGATNSAGYGNIGNGKGSTSLVHRVAYEDRNGPIPDGLTIDHTCNNKLCVRPDHLEAVTRTENIRRAPTGNTLKTRCDRGHELDDTNTTVRPDGRRRCKACHNEDGQRWQRENREKWNDGRARRRAARVAAGLPRDSRAGR